MSRSFSREPKHAEILSLDWAGDWRERRFRCRADESFKNVLERIGTCVAQEAQVFSTCVNQKAQTFHVFNH